MWNKIKKWLAPVGVAIAAGVAGLFLGKGIGGGKQRRADKREAKRINHDVNRGLESVQKGLESDIVKIKELGGLNRKAKENNNQSRQNNRAVKSEIENIRDIANRAIARSERIERENRKARGNNK